MYSVGVKGLPILLIVLGIVLALAGPALTLSASIMAEYTARAADGSAHALAQLSDEELQRVWPEFHPFTSGDRVEFIRSRVGHRSFLRQSTVAVGTMSLCVVSGAALMVMGFAETRARRAMPVAAKVG